MNRFFAGFATCALVVACIYVVRTLQPPVPSIPAIPATELKGEPTATLKCQPVVVYRDRVRDRLGIPKEAGHVTASANIPAADRPYTATATYREETGETSLYIRPEPLPWLAFDQKRELSLSYGVRGGHSGAVVRLGGRLDMVSIKALRFGVLADVDSGGGWFAGVGARATWR